METTVIILTEPFRGQVATKVGGKIKFDNGDLLMAESVQSIDWDDAVTVARKCDCCGNGMNEGYVYADDGYMCEACADKGELDRIVKEAGYENRDKAYDDDFHFFTDWDGDFDFDYVQVGGELIELIR